MTSQQTDSNSFFCPNCGAKVTSQDAFCPHCGFALSEFKKKHPTVFATQPDISDVPHPTEVTKEAIPPKPRQPIQLTMPKIEMTRRRKTILAVAAAVVIALGGAYFAGKVYFSPANQLSRAITAIADGNADQAVDYLTTTDTNAQITPQHIKPLLAYFKTNKSQLAEVQRKSQQAVADNELLSSESTQNLVFQASGRRFLLFPAYKFNLLTVYPKITTNQPSSLVNVSDVNTGFSGTQENREIGPLFPGTYRVTTTARISGHSVQQVRKENFGFDGATNLDMSFENTSFIAVGIPGAEVKINGESVGKINRQGQFVVSDYPVQKKGIKMTQTYSANGADVTSLATDISSTSGGGYKYDVKYPGVIDENEAERWISSVFSYEANSLARGNKPDDELADAFVGGTDSKKYQDFVKVFQGYAKDTSIDGVTMETEVTRVTPLKKNQARVMFTIKYTFRNKDGNGRHLQEFSYQGSLNQTKEDHYALANYDVVKKLSDKHED